MHWGSVPSQFIAQGRIKALRTDWNPEHDLWLVPLEELKRCQTTAVEDRPSAQIQKNWFFPDKNGCVWIPEYYVMELKTLIAAHSGCNGYRRIGVTLEALQLHFVRKSMKDDMDIICVLLHSLPHDGEQGANSQFDETSAARKSTKRADTFRLLRQIERQVYAKIHCDS